MSMPPCFLITLTFILNTVYIYSQISPTTVNSSGTFYIASATTGQRFTGAIICSVSYCHIVCDAAKACAGLKVDVISASTALVVQCRDYEDSCRNAVITVNTAYSVDLLCEYTNIYSSKAPCLGLDLHARNVQNGVRIVCNGDYVCRYANVSASNVGDSLTMICRGTGTCWSVDVYCLKDVQCNVTANHMRPNLITNDPTGAPSAPSSNPTSGPSQLPTISTPAPTRQPSDDPTMHPTQRPTVNPSAATVNPSAPTDEPTHEPTDEPTNEPTDEPSDEPQEAEVVAATADGEENDNMDNQEDSKDANVIISYLEDRKVMAFAVGFVVITLICVWSAIMYFCCVRKKKKKAAKSQVMMQQEDIQHTANQIDGDKCVDCDHKVDNNNCDEFSSASSDSMYVNDQNKQHIAERKESDIKELYEEVHDTKSDNMTLQMSEKKTQTRTKYKFKTKFKARGRNDVNDDDEGFVKNAYAGNNLKMTQEGVNDEHEKDQEVTQTNQGVADTKGVCDV